MSNFQVQSSVQSQPLYCGVTGIFGAPNQFLVHASNVSGDTVVLDVTPIFGSVTGIAGTTTTLSPALSPPFRPARTQSWATGVVNNNVSIGGGLFSVDTLGNMVYTFPASATGLCAVTSMSVRYAGQ